MEGNIDKMERKGREDLGGEVGGGRKDGEERGGLHILM